MGFRQQLQQPRRRRSSRHVDVDALHLWWRGLLDAHDGLQLWWEGLMDLPGSRCQWHNLFRADDDDTVLVDHRADSQEGVDIDDALKLWWYDIAVVPGDNFSTTEQYSCQYRSHSSEAAESYCGAADQQLLRSASAGPSCGIPFRASCKVLARLILYTWACASRGNLPRLVATGLPKARMLTQRSRLRIMLLAWATHANVRKLPVIATDVADASAEEVNSDEDISLGPSPRHDLRVGRGGA